VKLEKQEISETQLRLFVAGRWDMMGNRIFELEFPKFLSETIQSIIIDLSRLEFIASIGIRSLVSQAKDLNEKDVSLVISNPPELIKDVLTNVGIENFIEVIEEDN
jgi:anti-sigma B factor antagonist